MKNETYVDGRAARGARMLSRARGERRGVMRASHVARSSSSLGGGGRRARSAHDRGTRRARACLAWVTMFLLALSLMPRAWYARYIDVFGEKGEQSIGERIEARIRAREMEREAARLAAARRRGGASAFGWFGTSRRARAGEVEAREAAEGRGRGAVSVDGGEKGVDGRVESRAENGGGGDGEPRRELSEREQSILNALKERLAKINKERDSIIYLVRKMKGESLDSADSDFKELTENEIEELSEKMALRSESKSLLKDLITRG